MNVFLGSETSQRTNCVEQIVVLESVAERSVMKVLCAQIGARRNYEMPWQLHQTQQLSLLVTDFWNPLGDTFKVGEAWLPVVVRGAQA